MVIHTHQKHRPDITDNEGRGHWYKPVGGYGAYRTRKDDLDRTVYTAGYDNTAGKFSAVENGDIGFYRHGQPPDFSQNGTSPFGAFANTCGGFGSFYIRKHAGSNERFTFHSREQAFQSTKFKPGSKGFKAAMDPSKKWGKAAAQSFRDLKGSYSRDIPPDPSNKAFVYGDLIMFSTIMCNVTQDARLLDLLLNNTYKKDGSLADIFENSPGDCGWGVGPDGTGENKLGRMLMKARELLLAEYKSTGTIKQRDSIHDDLLHRKYDKHATVLGKISGYQDKIGELTAADLDRLCPTHTKTKVQSNFTYKPRYAQKQTNGRYVFVDCKDRYKDHTKPAVTPDIFTPHNPGYTAPPTAWGSDYQHQVGQAITKRFNLTTKSVSFSERGLTITLPDRRNTDSFVYFLKAARFNVSEYSNQVTIPVDEISTFLINYLKFNEPFVDKVFSQHLASHHVPAHDTRTHSGTNIFKAHNPDYAPRVVEGFGSTISQALFYRFNLGESENKGICAVPEQDGSLVLAFSSYDRENADALIQFLSHEGIEARLIGGRYNYEVQILPHGVHQFLANHLQLPDQFIDSYYEQKYTTPPPKRCWVTKDDIDTKSHKATSYRQHYIQSYGTLSDSELATNINSLLYDLITRQVHDKELASAFASYAELFIKQPGDSIAIGTHTRGELYGIVDRICDKAGIRFYGNEQYAESEPVDARTFYAGLQRAKAALEKDGTIKPHCYSLSDTKSRFQAIDQRDLTRFGTGGSGHFYKFKDGHQYFLQDGFGSEREAREYMLMSRLYRLAGENTPYMMLVNQGAGKFAVAVETVMTKPSKGLADKDKGPFYTGSATDLWLGNSYNLTQDRSGAGIVADAGSPAAGEAVRFSFRKQRLSDLKPDASETVPWGSTGTKVKKDSLGVLRLASIGREDIRAEVAKCMGGTLYDRENTELVDKLVQRKDAVVQKHTSKAKDKSSTPPLHTEVDRQLVSLFEQLLKTYAISKGRDGKIGYNFNYKDGNITFTHFRPELGDIFRDSGIRLHQTYSYNDVKGKLSKTLTTKGKKTGKSSELEQLKEALRENLDARGYSSHHADNLQADFTKSADKTMVSFERTKDPTLKTLLFKDFSLFSGAKYPLDDLLRHIQENTKEHRPRHRHDSDRLYRSTYRHSSDRHGMSQLATYVHDTITTTNLIPDTSIVKYDGSSDELTLDVSRGLPPLLALTGLQPNRDNLIVLSPRDMDDIHHNIQILNNITKSLFQPIEYAEDAEELLDTVSSLMEYGLWQPLYHERKADGLTFIDCIDNVAVLDAIADIAYDRGHSELVEKAERNINAISSTVKHPFTSGTVIGMQHDRGLYG